LLLFAPSMLLYLFGNTFAGISYKIGFAMQTRACGGREATSTHAS